MDIEHDDIEAAAACEFPEQHIRHQEPAEEEESVHTEVGIADDLVPEAAGFLFWEKR